MKIATRAKLRGKPLDGDCKKAHTSRNEYGNDDNRVFCYGLVDLMNDEYLPKCKQCGAFVDNSEPPREESNWIWSQKKP